MLEIRKTYSAGSKDNLSKTRKNLIERVERVLGGRTTSGSILDELEEILITSDLGIRASKEIIGILKDVTLST